MSGNSLTSIEHMQAHQRLSFAMGRLFGKLRECIRIVPRSGDAADDFSHDYKTEFVTGYTDDDDPGLLIMNTFKENGELWLAAAPTDVVVLPREQFNLLVGALPPLPAGPFQSLPALGADDWARIGRDMVIRAADSRRACREREEFEKRHYRD